MHLLALENQVVKVDPEAANSEIIVSWEGTQVVKAVPTKDNV